MRRLVTRRRWLANAAAAGFARTLLASGFDRSLIGANTAIRGAGLVEAIELLARIGFHTIEFHSWGTPDPVPNVFPGFELEKLDNSARRKISSILERFRHRSAHLPHTGPNYFSANASESTEGLRRIDLSLEGALHFGATRIVIHPRNANGIPREKHWPIMVHNFRRWADRAAKAGAQLALETGYPGSVEEFVEFIQEIDHPAVGATLDVGHQSRYRELVQRVAPGEKSTPGAIRAYNDINIDLVKRLGPKLLHLHIHDIDPDTWEEHKPLGIGFIDYPRFLRTLKDTGYRGMFIFEIGGEPQSMPAHLVDSKRRFEAFLLGS